MQVRKSNGSIEEFDNQKVKDSICSAYEAVGEVCDDLILQSITNSLYVYDNISTMEIRRQVEDALMSINKKVALIEQLNKSIKEKVNDIIRARNNSPYVLRLIESQEKHWMERQKLYEVYSAVKARHKQVTDNGTRKALALTALKSWIQSLPPTGTNDPMSELNNAFQAAQTENKTLATQLARLQHELSLTQ